MSKNTHPYKTEQRFFNHLITAMQTPSMIANIETDLAAGHAAVIQIVSTGEALQERRLAEIPTEEWDDVRVDVTPREYVLSYLEHSFPVQLYEPFTDSEGNLSSRPVTDEDGNPVESREAVERRDRMIERLASLAPVPAALDQIIHHFGTDMVAEVTGRSRRIVKRRGSDGIDRFVVESRPGAANIAETDAFQSDAKRILIFSDAGGTGRSYHADLGARNQRLRIHYLLEAGWKADNAIQGFGRSNRTNQKQPPLFRPVTTDVKAQKRFISTIARRLDTLGAITRGQRQTGGQGLFDPTDNLESDLAKEALVQWYRLLHAGKLASIGLAAFEEMTGLSLTERKGGGLRERLPPIQRWLNRILALRIAVQNAIFDEYLGLIEARVDAARAAGTLDVGVETILAERIEVLDDRLLRRDPDTGAETRLQRLDLHIRRHATGFAQLMELWRTSGDIAFLHNRRSDRVALRVPSWSVTDEEGRPIVMCRLVRPTGSDRVALDKLWHSHWQPIGEADFVRRWEAEAAEARDRLDRETITIATGLLLPVWDKLPDDDVRVWRIADASGHSQLGRIVPPHALWRLAADFGVDAVPKLTVEETIAAATATEGVPLPSLGKARLHRALVNGDTRLEIRGYPPEKREWLKSLGCFVEIIQYRTRLFVPVDRAAAILATTDERDR